MPFHGLNILIALIIILGQVTCANNLDSNTKYLLDEVADFDDIVEDNNNNNKKVRVETSTRISDTSLRPIQNRKTTNVKHSRNQLRIKAHGIKNRQSSPFGLMEFNEEEPKMHKQLSKFNQFEQQQSYLVKDQFPQAGYYFVKEKEPDTVSAYDFDEAGIEGDTQEQIPSQNTEKRGGSVTVIPQEIKNGEQFPKSTASIPKDIDNCNEINKIFQIPLIEQFLFDTMFKGNNPHIGERNWKSLQYKIDELYPTFSKLNIMNKPESVECLRTFLKKRRKRHSTFRNSRHKRKKFNRLLKRNDAAEENLYLKNIIDEISKNKQFQMKYTYVPVVFATLAKFEEGTRNNIPTMIETTVSNNRPSVMTETETDPSTIESHLPIALEDTLETTEETKITTQVTNNVPSCTLAVSVGSPVEVNIPFSTPEHVETTTTGTCCIPQNPVILQEARNLTEELSFRIPQLRRNYMDILDIPRIKSCRTKKNIQGKPRAQKRIRNSNGHRKRDIQTTEHSTSFKSTQPSVKNNIEDLIPGVLFYPKRKNKVKRYLFNLFDEVTKMSSFSNQVVSSDESSTSIEGTSTHGFVPASYNTEYIDFNSLRKLKKDVDHECQNETEEILNALNSANIKMPADFATVETENTEASTTITTSISSTDIPNGSQANVEVPDVNSLSTFNLDVLMTVDPSLLPNLESNTQSVLNTIGYVSLDLTTPAKTTEGELCSEETTENIPSQIVVETTAACIPQVTTTPKEEELPALVIPVTTTPKKQEPSALVIPKDLPLKLSRLESDLKLVNEVQNILNGVNEIKHNVKKREIVPQYIETTESTNTELMETTTECPDSTPLFELNFKIVSTPNEADMSGDIQKEVSGLGKILKWKASKSGEKCRRKRHRRRKRRARKRTRKKKRTHPRNRRFLFRRTQNSL